MALIARQTLNLVKPELTLQKYKMLHYFFAEAVLHLETIDFSKFKTPITESGIFTQSNILHINQFNKFVESYIDGTNLYKNFTQSRDISEWADIRTLYSNNSWVLGRLHHDMFHLHYSYGHPYYAAVNFQASRSINNRRYIMISSLWESIDTFRSVFEDSIADYMGENNMTPEMGMLLLATASEAELTKIEKSMESKALGIDEAAKVSYYPNAYNGWKPVKTRFGRNSLAYDDNSLRLEIAHYINSVLENLSTPAKKRYVNFHRIGPGQTSSLDEDRVAGF